MDGVAMQTLCLHNWFDALSRTGQVNTYRGGEKKGGPATGMLVDVSGFNINMMMTC